MISLLVNFVYVLMSVISILFNDCDYYDNDNDNDNDNE